MMTRVTLIQLFEAYPFLAECIRHSIRVNGWNLPAIAIADQWGMRAADKARMLEVMRDNGICNRERTHLTEYGVKIGGRLLS